MIRILLLLIVGFLGFKISQSLLRYWLKPRIPPQGPVPEVEQEELVQDPVCKVFIPRRNALVARKGGETFYFCSEGCRKKFLRS